ncbi:flagellin [Solicola sp. PLA-1-18]|uniref:flagellin N-terminal helical domain-containing protein n=1 Tax=Solicola sp. PLA-1-18 TaxID=3380532 RepID=UPI003B826F02
MTTPRITQRLMIDRSVGTVHASLGRLAVVQEQLATGKTINRPSDSPTGTAAVLARRQELREVEQNAASAADGADWLAQTDSVLQGALTSVRRAQQITLQGANSGSIGQGGRDALAAEVDQIRNQLLGEANSTRLGRPLFGGTTDQARAYDPTTGAYLGDAGAVERTVAADERVRVDVSGPQAFGDGADSVFAALETLAANLRTPGASLSGDLDAMNGALARISGALTDVGARGTRLEKVIDVAASRKLDLQARISDVEDIDLAEAATELGLREMAYQAALGATARVLQPSLVDFLR